MRKIFIIFFLIVIGFAHCAIAYAVDTCAGYQAGDKTHSQQSGVCVYALRSGESPGYTTDPSKQDCGGPGPLACSTIPDCNQITPNTHGITDDISNCNGDFGNSYKCCAPDVQPSPSFPPAPCTTGGKDNTTCVSVNTGLGPISTDPSSLVGTIVDILLGISGGIATVIIIISGYRIVFSQGDPEKLQGAQEAITSAIIGLLFIIFSVVILRIIGVDILHIPGLNK